VANHRQACPAASLIGLPGGQVPAARDFTLRAIDPINRAIEAGVSVTTFAADPPNSKRTAYITSDNLAKARFAAEGIVKTVGDSAEHAVLDNPGQSNHDLQMTALIAYMEANYPNMKLVGRHAANQDPNAAFTAVSAMLRANPDLAALSIPGAGSTEGAVAAVKAAGDSLMIIHADITPGDVVNAMIGRKLDTLFPPKATARNEAEIPRVEGLTGARFRDVSFSLRRGEILGLGGLVGAGRTEIALGRTRLVGHPEGRMCRCA
jgi:hypothetical protein